MDHNAQNTRFLVLAQPDKWPNLASCVLKLVAQRLAQDWKLLFGYAVLAMESFVDPQRFHATCYKAAGWQQLGVTQGFERNWQDFYTDTKHPKELWMCPLSSTALEELRAGQLPPSLNNPKEPLPPACPVATANMDSLWECFRLKMTDPRNPRGVRHKLASLLTLIALAVVAGCKGPHAIAQFVESLTHAQRGRLRCRPRAGRPREFDVPCERTLRRMLKKVDCQELTAVLVGWMQTQDSTPLTVVHMDGKVVKNAQPAPERPQAQHPEPAPSEPCEIPLEKQKPKAEKTLTLVNFHTSDQRLVDQVAVPGDTNEEAAVAAHLPKMDLVGVCITADAAHTTKANCRQLTQVNGADLVMILKDNQPLALAKAQQLLPGNTPCDAHTLDKAHGRIELREIWCAPTDPQTIGLAAVAQVMRIHRHVQTLRKGKVIKETDEVVFAVTSLWPDEAGAQQLLALLRDHWSIENGQHYRRDRTQDEDRCQVRNTVAARNLSLFRSLAIFLFMMQLKGKEGKKSLPDFEKHVHRQPRGVIHRFMPNRLEE